MNINTTTPVKMERTSLHFRASPDSPQLLVSSPVRLRSSVNSPAVRTRNLSPGDEYYASLVGGTLSPLGNPALKKSLLQNRKSRALGTSPSPKGWCASPPPPNSKGMQLLRNPKSGLQTLSQMASSC